MAKPLPSAVDFSTTVVVLRGIDWAGELFQFNSEASW